MYTRGPGLGLLPRLTRATKALLILTVGAFVLQVLGDRLTDGYFTRGLFGLTLSGLRRGCLWQAATYMFLHGGPLHLLFNMLVLFFFGPDLERVLGMRRFAVLYLACGIMGGLGWVMLNRMPYAYCVGASAAVFGLIGCFAALFPDRPITLWLFLVLPITMTARVLALGLGLMSLLALFSRDSNIAHAAHLAGGLAGFLYGARLSKDSGHVVYGPWPGSRTVPRPWHRARHRMQPPDETPGAEEAHPPTAEEVDAILDKISERGFRSLTHQERSALDRASKQYRQR